MKKALSLLLIFVLCISALLSCNFGTNNGDDESPFEIGEFADSIASRTNVPDENYTPKDVVFSEGDTEEDDFINLFSPDVLVEIEIDITAE